MTVTWRVTEEHSADIEVDDDFSIEDELDSNFLAELEGDDTYDFTADREVMDAGFIESHGHESGTLGALLHEQPIVGVPCPDHLEATR